MGTSGPSGITSDIFSHLAEKDIENMKSEHSRAKLLEQRELQKEEYANQIIALQSKSEKEKEKIIKG